MTCWGAAKFGLRPADTVALNMKYNMTSVILTKPKHFINDLKAVASKVADIEGLNAGLEERKKKRCEDFKEMLSGLFEAVGQDPQLPENACILIGKTERIFTGKPVALDSILKTAVKLLSFELCQEPPYFCKSSTATLVANCYLRSTRRSTFKEGTIKDAPRSVLGND